MDTHGVSGKIRLSRCDGAWRGVAVGVHGFVRATKDLGIVPDPTPDNLARLARLLKET